MTAPLFSRHQLDQVRIEISKIHRLARQPVGGVARHRSLDDLDSALIEQCDGARDAAIPAKADIRRANRGLPRDQLDSIARLMHAQQRTAKRDLPNEWLALRSVIHVRFRREQSVIEATG